MILDKNIFNDSIMEGFKKDLIISGKASNRINVYINRIRKFHNFIGKSYIDVKHKDIQGYIIFLKVYEGHKYDSLSRNLSTIRQFYKFLFIRGYVAKNPCIGIRIHRY